MGISTPVLGVRRLLEKAAEVAPGLPDRSRFEPLPSVSKPTPFKFNTQIHHAVRAGTHIDLRLADSATGHAHSWALKKLPEPGIGTYAVQQPTHQISYLGWSGEIPQGTYGAGTVESQRFEDAEVVSSGPNEVRFNLYGRRVPEQFVLRRTSGDRMWVLHNATPSRQTQRWGSLIPDYKPQLGHVQFKALDPSKPGELMQPKIDGAHAIMVAEGGKPVRVFSYRDAKNETGLIEHTHKMPEWWRQVAPLGLKPTVLRVEITGRDAQGQPVPSQVIGGILNAAVPTSRKLQEEQGVRLRLLGHGVQREDGRIVEDPQGRALIPFERQQQVIKRLAHEIPMLYPIPTASTPEEKRRLIADVASGHHSLTREGVVVIRPEINKVYKAPQVETHDVYIRKVLPSIRPGEAGGFEFSHTETGPVVGVTGTGFTREQRKNMLRDPESWIGRVAKVTAKEQFRSGALRAPVFQELHLDKGRTALG